MSLTFLRKSFRSLIFFSLVSSFASVAAAREIPRRPAGALSGSAFIRSTFSMSPEARERAVLAEIRKGNIPNFLRKLRPVSTTLQGKDGQRLKATIWVMPDYLAIGSDQDFIRIPMTPITAQKIADEFGFILPTKKMVDEVSRQAQVKLDPIPFSPGPNMVKSDTYLKHQLAVERQRKGRQLGLLTSGHKKDVVITNKLVTRPKRVAIYGWYRRNGSPIQPLSLVHHEDYADYSHGIRLVSKRAEVNGRRYDIAELLRTPKFAPLLSDEGRIAVARAHFGGNGKTLVAKNTKPRQQKPATFKQQKLQPKVKARAKTRMI